MLSSPSVVRPTARVTTHRKTKMITARITISISYPSRPQPGVEGDGRHGLTFWTDHAHCPVVAALAGRLDIGVVGDGENLALRCVEREVKRVRIRVAADGSGVNPCVS